MQMQFFIKFLMYKKDGFSPTPRTSLGRLIEAKLGAIQLGLSEQGSILTKMHGKLHLLEDVVSVAGA